MKKMFGVFVLSLCVVGLMLCFGGCMGPPKLEKLEEIQPNETAYLIALEGDTKDNQDVFKSVEYLETKKVAAKRVSLSQRKVATGRMPWQYKWVPTEIVVKVDRSPVTREWTKGSNGTSPSDQAIAVEDNSGIGFTMGVNVTASVPEADTSKFLYKYSNKALAQIIDTNIRGTTQSIMAAEFATMPLSECVTSKRKVMETLKKGLTEIYGPFGITIDSIGFAEGITFQNPEIQKAIDKKFQSETEIKTAENENQAQQKRNEMKVSMAKADREAAEEFQKAMEAQKAKMTLEATIGMAKQWNGVLPNYLIIGGSDGLGKLSMFLPSPNTNEKAGQAKPPVVDTTAPAPAPQQ